MERGDNGSGRKPSLAFAYQPGLSRGVYSSRAVARLERFCEIVDPIPLTSFDDERARAVIGRVEILATGWGCPHIGPSVVAAMPNLALVAHGAGTVKALLSSAVYDAGITVTNAVAANALPVAEYTLAAIIFANKRVLTFRDMYRAERASLQRHPIMESNLGNFHKTIGVIGASRIGRRLIELLRPFDFTVLLSDPHVNAAEARELGVELVDLDDLIVRSDVVTLHAPALESTRHMIDARRLALMGDGATFINTSRGSLVDQAALERELVAGRIEAVIDVTDPEVLPAASPLYDLPNVLLTPHIAGAVGAERERLGDMAVDEIERFVTGKPLLHAVAPMALERLA